MAGIGGPLESLSLNGRRFVTDADDDAQIQVQGYSNEVKMSGDGTPRMLKSRNPGTLEGCNICYDPFNGDDDFLTELKNNKEWINLSATECDGTIWSGRVQITGDLKFSTKNKTVPITLTGVFQKQG